MVVIMDDQAKTFSVEGPVVDDTKWIEAVCAAQRAGRRVRCNAPTGITNVDVAAARYARRYPDMRQVERGSIVSLAIP